MIFLSTMSGIRGCVAVHSEGREEKVIIGFYSDVLLQSDQDFRDGIVQRYRLAARFRLRVSEVIAHT